MDNLLFLFNPSNQARYCQDLQRVYQGTAPSLKEVNDTFGVACSKSWLEIELRDLGEFAGVSKQNLVQITQTAEVIMVAYPYLTLTELMHFFLLFKQGEFGKFYGVVDGLVITNALQDYMKYRNEILIKLDNIAKKRREEAEKAWYEKAKRERDEFWSKYNIQNTRQEQEFISQWLKEKNITDEQYIADKRAKKESWITSYIKNTL